MTVLSYLLTSISQSTGADCSDQVTRNEEILHHVSCSDININHKLMDKTSDILDHDAHVRDDLEDVVVVMEAGADNRIFGEFII